MVNNLLENGIDKITIVCGYKGELIKEYCHKIFPDRNFNFINNKDYSTSNNLYSLYLASEAFKEGSFLMNADIIFDSSVLALMQKTDDSCVAVDTSQYIEESMKVTVTEESISSISKKITETKDLNKEKTVSLKDILTNYSWSKNYGKAFTFTQEGYDKFLLTTVKNITLEGNNIGYLAISENANDIRAAINERKTFILRTAIFVGIVIFVFSSI